MKISVAKSSKERYWLTKDMDFKTLCFVCTKYTTTSETCQEFDALKKEEKVKLKDVGGFVGGELSKGRRKKGSVINRCVLCLDADFADDSFPDKVKEFLGNYNYIVASTRSDRPDNRRFRLVVPLKEVCSPDEYEPICRKIAEIIGIKYFDTTTFQSERLMFFPSKSADQKEEIHINSDKEFLDKNTILAKYKDWSNPDEWAYSESEESFRPRELVSKQENPLDKKGVVGAFCKSYTVPMAIEKYLSDIYTPFEGHSDRYTYVKGSTAGGLVVYDDVFAYSHHDTDPAGKRLCNAWDLVRIHKFGNSTRSNAQMTDLALKSDEVVLRMGMEGQQRVNKIFATEMETNAELDAQLARDKKTGAVLPTVPNMLLIFEHDDALKDSFRYDQFAERMRIVKPLVWRQTDSAYDTWQDPDWSGLYNYLAVKYGFTGRLYKSIADDVFNTCKMTRAYHPVKEYLEKCQKIWDGKKRAETLFSEFLGAEDSKYVRTVCRKMLLGAVRRIYRPACQFDSMCVLVGGQGGGKTSLLRRLGGQWFTNSIRDLGNKDAIQQLEGNWIIELGELSAMKRSDIDTVKNFITRTVDKYRPAYGHEVKDRPRMSILFGTCNDTNFLSDMSGNRRFWVVDCEQDRAVAKNYGFKVNSEMTADFVAQVWGEVMSWGLEEPLYLPDDVLDTAIELEEKYSASSDVLDVIRNYLNAKVPEDWEKWTLDRRVNWWKQRNDPNAIEVKGTKRREQFCVIEIYQEVVQACNLKELIGGVKGLRTLLRGLNEWVYTSKRNYSSPSYGYQRMYMRKKVAK